MVQRQDACWCPQSVHSGDGIRVAPIAMVIVQPQQKDGDITAVTGMLQGSQSRGLVVEYCIRRFI